MLNEKRYAIDNMNFVAMLAHDMKTPVKAQVRAMDLLNSGALGKFSEEVNTLVSNIIASNKYLQTLLDNVLGNYRLSNGNFVLNKTENDIRKTIEETLDNIGILMEVKGQKVSINYLTGDFIKNYDEIEIQRVLINLISNAFEYAKENSEIKITVKKENYELKIEVESKTAKRQISNKKKFEFLKAGEGLGLLICSEIIAAHGGKFYKEINESGEYITAFSVP